MTVLVCISNDLFALLVLTLSIFYLGCCYQYINAYYKNLDTFKQIVANIPTHTIATPIHTPLITPALVTTPVLSNNAAYIPPIME